MTFLDRLAALMWGPGMLALILGAGVYLTIGTRFLSIRHLRTAFRMALGKHPDRAAEGEVSGFGALCTSLAATLGTGNIIGVATAITAGGPGALFWMQLAALFGMATKYAESFLAVRYRQKGADGHFLGGPFLYLEQGLKRPALARLFAIACVSTCLISMGTTSQINGIVTAAEDFFDPDRALTAFRLLGRWVTWPALIVGLLTTILIGLVLAGGIRRIAAVSSVLVPVMAGLYTLLTVWLILLYLPALPEAVRLVIRSAFAPRAALGASTGITLQQAIRYGLGRGIYSNEAGMGSDPIAAAAAQTDSPVRQGLISMLGPFIDTVLMCSLTGYAVILTGAWRVPDINGAGITLHALKFLPLPHGLLAFLYMLCLVFFGFSSIIGWSYYGEQSLRYLFPRQGRSVQWFRRVFLIMLMVGAVLSPAAAWNLADIFCGLMAVPNLIGLIGLGPQVFRGTRQYFIRSSSCPAPKRGG